MEAYMAVLVTVDIPAAAGGSAEEAARWAERNKRDLPATPGFIFHADGPTETGWRLVQVWESEEDVMRNFNENVRPQLPPDAPANPMRVQPLSNFITARGPKA
jgi:hypothetical protein